MRRLRPSHAFQRLQDWRRLSGRGVLPVVPRGHDEPQAGAYSPLTLTFSRQDREQDFKALERRCLRACWRSSRVSRCAGKRKRTRGTCVGSVADRDGDCRRRCWSDPFYVKGKVFLTGRTTVDRSVRWSGARSGGTVQPRHGRGPGFDQGQPEHRAGEIVSDPFPSILDGVPLQVKTVNVTIDREGFTFNPTNCDALAIDGTLIATQGASAEVSSHFQAADCASLPFKPSFSASTQGRTSRADGASLTVKVAQKAGEADIHRVDLQLPLTLPGAVDDVAAGVYRSAVSADPAGCPAAR